MDSDQKQAVDEQITVLSEVIYQIDVIHTDEIRDYNQLSSFGQAGPTGKSIEHAIATLEAVMESLKSIQKTLQELT
ncbi:MAG TPA: hypothetical protein VM940_05505 [Chthoniobacterales bacterium]|jgi:hypothetical protein|nr:hypothetical protein [Chthoniobacterales bacterium]